MSTVFTHKKFSLSLVLAIFQFVAIGICIMFSQSFHTINLQLIRLKLLKRRHLGKMRNISVHKC